MKFFEYGGENEKTLLIECGYLAKWNPGLQPFIKEVAKKYHVIVQAWTYSAMETVSHGMKAITWLATNKVDLIT